MLPELTNGDFVIVSKLYFKLKVGDLIVAEHPKYKSIIKRVIKMSTSQGVMLTGTAQESVSSDKMGWISPQHILGKVFCHFKK